MPKLPKPEILLKAIREYDNRALSNGQVDTLVAVWPKESSIKELAAEKLGKNEQWDRAEAYFVRIASLGTLQSRLSVWQFKTQFSEGLMRAHKFRDDINEMYNIILTNQYFMQMLSVILAVGNILNGGTNKGQADGFDLNVLGKVHTFRDNGGTSILEYVCRKMFATHQEKFNDNIENCRRLMAVKGTDIDTLKQIS